VCASQKVGQNKAKMIWQAAFLVVLLYLEHIYRTFFNGYSKMNAFVPLFTIPFFKINLCISIIDMLLSERKILKNRKRISFEEKKTFFKELISLDLFIRSSNLGF
jgi:hypothetical protein